MLLCEVATQFLLDDGVNLEELEAKEDEVLEG